MPSKRLVRVLVILGAGPLAIVGIILEASAGAHPAAVPHVASAAASGAPAPTFDRRRYQAQAGYVTVLVHTHLQVNSPSETCRLTVSGPAVPARSFTHADITGDFEMTFAVGGVRPGVWHLAETCQTARSARSRIAHATVRVTGGHGHGALGAGYRPYFNAQQPPLSAGSGGPGVPPAAQYFADGQCTYYAYERRPDIYLQSVAGGALGGGLEGDGTYWWDATNWAYNAAHYGHFQEGTTPEPDAIMVEPGRPGNPEGHVAYVSAVTDASHFTTLEMNTDGNGTPDKVFTVYDDTSLNPNSRDDPSRDYYVGEQIHRHILPGTVFIYGGAAVNPPQYASELNHIVQWSGDTKAQKTAWLVVNEGGQLHRHWIPTIAIYWCLKNSGDAGPDVLSSAELDAMPDDTGVSATCTGNTSQGGAGGGSGGGPTTYSETEGHNGVNTFTDPTTAGGLGQRVAPAQQVQVTCKLYAPQVASVNPDGYWYLIASAPWNDAYYAPANTFMNGDPWNGPYTHNTDFNVPDCSGTPQPTATTTMTVTTPPVTTTITSTTTTAPASQSWGETVGGNAHTWTDYANAGGTEGPAIPAYQTVQIACAVQGFVVADGNPWWYRIASAPWSDAYYVSADAFYNDGATSGSLIGTPWVDPAVARC